MHDLRGRASERRQLTVLFCDIVDSTGLSERCDPEDLSEILLEFQAISTRCINDAGGNVINYIGDGIRSEFGYPLASENEAECAVRAGLALLSAIERLGERSTATIQEPLRVRIGVHTGVAVIGKAASGHVHDATEMVGDTPNIAFRLQEIGGPNSLVVSGETQRLLKGKFQLRPLGFHALKGLSRKMQAFQVLGEAMEDYIAQREHHRNASRIVGRSLQIDQLLQTWEVVKTGRGQTVEITGEAGIGKSRLALELIDKIGLGEESIVVLQSSAHHQNTPLYPIVRRIEQRIGIRKDESVEANAARVRDFLASAPSDDDGHLLIRQLLGLPMPRPAASTIPDAQEVRRKTRDIVVELLTSHARVGAGLILVEDLHWADPSTVEIVERIAGRISNMPILLVVTGRTDTIRSGSTVIRRVPLQRLADDDCRVLADSVVRDKQLLSKLIEQIVKRSDGVPLFVEELVAAALETGQVDPGGSTSVVASGHDVPSPLYDSLMLRLERLGEAKAIAQLASVIGRSFSHQLLAAIATEHGNAFEPTLARLLESGLIWLEHDDDEKVYSFKHALVRDVAYYSLLKRQRRELHARVADKIEIHLPETVNREPDYLAQHLSEAGRPASAVRMWLKAAQQSAERSANLEGLAQLSAALEQVKKLPAGPERDDLELNVQIALIAPTIAVYGFSAPSVADVSSRAIDLCRVLNDDPRIFPALYARWSNVRVAGNVREASVLASNFLSLAEQKGTRTDRMVGHRLVGTSLIDWETELACEHLEKAIALYDPATDRTTAIVYGTDVNVTSLSNLSIGCWLLGRVTQAVERGQSALTLAMELRHAHTFGYAFAHVCMLHTLERDIDTVKSLAGQMLAAATKRELPLWMSVSRAFLGWCELEAGRLLKGIEILEGERGFLRAAHVSYWLPMYLCWLAEVYADTGNLKEAKACLGEARAIIGGANFWYEIECLRIEARIAGDDDQAEYLFEQALALARQRGQMGFALRTARGFADYLARKGQPERGCKLLQQALLPFLDQQDSGDRADAKALLSSLQHRVSGLAPS